MTFLHNICDDQFFQRNTAEFNWLLNQLLEGRYIHPTLSQEISSIKKSGERVIIKLNTKGCLIRKIYK